MKKLITLILLISLPFLSSAQFFYGQDILKFSTYNEVGTARSQGMGGALTALGGDPSSAIINPAGLGFFNRNSFTISPFIYNQNNTTTYIGQSTTVNPSNTAIGQAAVVFSRPGTGTRKKRSNFAISYNTLVSFNNDFEYNGVNQVSSIQDLFAEQINLTNPTPASLEEFYDPNLGLAQSANALYYFGYAVEDVGDRYVVFEPGLPVDQKGRVTERGNLGQLSLSFANNLDDKLYLGATVGIQNLNYNSTDYIDEVYSSPEFLSGLRSTSELNIQGTGFNLNVGTIYRVSDAFNVGASIATPTWMGVRETIVRTIAVDPFENRVETSFGAVQQVPNLYNYRFAGPFRANIGGAYYLPKKVGVLSAELNYVNFGGMTFTDRESQAFTSEQQVFIDQNYADAINVKLGGEIRAGKARFRAGYNFNGDPFAIQDIDRSTQVFSLGAGLRGARFFADASFRRITRSQVYTPYELSDASAFASAVVDGSINTFSITLGANF